MDNECEGLPAAEGAEELGRLSQPDLVQRLLRLQGEINDLREQLQTQQITDALTGLANRVYFFASLDRLWLRAKRFNQQVCVALVDVDNFRLVNEQHGHMAGDLVLTGLADMLRSVVRNYDLLARIGEDEFAVAIDNATPAMARQLGDRIRKVVADNPICANDRVVAMTVTAGVAIGRPDDLGDAAEVLVRSALEATEIARQKGHNQSHTLAVAAG